MVAILSTLTMLQSLCISLDTSKFESQRHPTLTRVVLPALTYFYYWGNRKYLEGFVSRFDAPLDRVTMLLTTHLVVFNNPLLRDFIGRTKIPDVSHRTDISFTNSDATISLFQAKGGVDFEKLCLDFPFSSSTLAELSLVARACNSFLPLLPSLDQLGIYNPERKPLFSRWQSQVENTQWIDLLRPFTTVKDLTLGEPVVLSIASALGELVGERATEILPALQNVFLEGFRSSDRVPKGIAKFVAARELSGRPVIVHHRKGK